ncbi:MAG: hypothetical protein ACC645_26215, partial [Pirellulales bacterium]
MQNVTEHAPLANHRLYLSNPNNDKVIRYRIIAPKPDGTSVVSDEATFLFKASAPIAGNTLTDLPQKSPVRCSMTNDESPTRQAPNPIQSNENPTSVREKIPNKIPTF